MQLDRVTIMTPTPPRSARGRLRIRPLLALGLLALCQMPLAFADPAVAYCKWATTPGLLILQRNMGTLYVPRDAAIGSVIGVTPAEVRTQPVDGRRLMCYLNRPAEGIGLTLSYASTASVPVFGGSLPPVNGQDMNGKVLQTNIPGVGAHISLGLHYDGTSANAFAPDNPREGARVPFTATARTGMLTEFPASNHHNVVTLVKIGAIPSGPQNLDGSELFRGTYSDVGTATSFGLTGTVIQAQCTVTSNPVSADPVQLGEWQSSDFTGPGFTTATVPFNIQLSNCETDSSGATIATAHMKLEGKDGSVSVDPALGVFSLTSNSSAKGVGIQILKADGITPMPLDAEVPLVTLSPGDIRVHFNARFYQTAAAVQAGDAKGALGFTMTYK